MTVIELRSRTDSDFLTRRHGELLVPEIQRVLACGDDVALDFKDIETALPSFFNAIVGASYAVRVDHLADHVTCRNSNDLQRSAWRTAVENALAFMRNPDEREARRRAAAEALIEN